MRLDKLPYIPSVLPETSFPLSFQFQCLTPQFCAVEADPLTLLVVEPRSLPLVLLRSFSVKNHIALYYGLGGCVPHMQMLKS